MSVDRYCHPITTVEIYIERVGAGRVDVMTNGCAKACDVRWTARTAKPASSHRRDVIVDAIVPQRFGMHFERINIEIVTPVERDTIETGIVERALHQVGITAVQFHLQHTAREHHQANRRATFHVRRIIWQIVIAAERFPGALRADGSDNTDLPLDHFLP